MRRPRYEVKQLHSLDWLAALHAASQASSEPLTDQERTVFAERLRKVMDHCACGPHKIASRGVVIADMSRFEPSEMAIYDVRRDPLGQDAGERVRLFDRIVSAYFAEEYESEQQPPSDLIHVTCTGYSAPSGAQKLVSSRGWGDRARVTHAYHMGCSAAFPAIRMAVGFLYAPRELASEESERRVDIVHTELCSLHLDPSDHSIEQLVIQSLFADGLVRYSVRASQGTNGLEVLALREAILGDSIGSMSWVTSSAGMRMTLARDVPERIAGSLRGFVASLYQKAGFTMTTELPRSVFAVHPGGPRIIDRVQEVLELLDGQLDASRNVLLCCGNMSSATLPHIWRELWEDQSLPRGTLVVSLAFGPGLTISGGLFRKH